MDGRISQKIWESWQIARVTLILITKSSNLQFVTLILYFVKAVVMVPSLN